MKIIKIFTLAILLMFNFHVVNAAVGCMVRGGNIIYPNYNTYALGVVVGGVNLGIPSYIYTLSAPLYTESSCTMPWVNNYRIIGTCTYGTPAAVFNVAATCSNCVAGDLVDYSVTMACDLDDYTWTLSVTAAALGMLLIRKKMSG